jgi:hypothetical protein
VSVNDALLRHIAPLGWITSIREKPPDDLWELAEVRERLGEALLKAESGPR